MKRLALLGMLVAIGMLHTEAVAGGQTVSVQNNLFAPDEATLAEPGLAIDWDWVGGGFPHNVRQDDLLFRSGPTTSSPAASFQRVFSAGTFHYYCENHGFPTGGMDGVIRVRPIIGDAPVGLPFTVRWATSTTNTGGVFDVRYRVNDGPWRTWRTDTTRVASRFGVNDMPIRVRPGRTYRFRARSQVDAGSPTAVSGWSPIRSITV